MATIVTMGSGESSTVVISPNSASSVGFRSNNNAVDEPPSRILPESLRFCLDGNNRDDNSRREVHPDSEGMLPVKKVGSDSTYKTEVSDDSPLRAREKTIDSAQDMGQPPQLPEQQQQNDSPNKEHKGDDEDSSDDEEEEKKKENKSSNGNANSPSLLNNDLQKSLNHNNKQPSCESQAPQRTGRSDSIIFMQDMYDDGDEHPDHCNDQDDDDDEDDDFYFNQQQGPYLTPPAPSHKKEPSKNNAAIGKDQNGFGTPPSTLRYAADPQSFPLLPPPAQEQSDDHHLHSSNNTPGSVSTSASCLSVSPAPFPFDEGSIPKSSRPMMYSAIGSLETCSAHSLKTMKQNANNKGGGLTEFSKFHTANLIAPRLQQPYPPPQQPRQQPDNKAVVPVLLRGKGDAPVRLSLTASHDKFGDHPTATDNKDNSTSDGSSKRDSPVSDDHAVPNMKTSPSHQAAFAECFRAVQQKMDERERRKSPNSQLQQIQRKPEQQQANTNQHNSAGAATTSKPKLESSMKKSKDGAKKKSVKIDSASLAAKKPSAKKPVVEMFRPSCDAYTPRMERKKITYKPAEQRTPVQGVTTTMGTLQRPNFRDALRRVAMLIHQHIVKIEGRFASTAAAGGDPSKDEGLFKESMREAFSEENFATPRYKCTVVRVPMARPGMNFGLKKIRPRYKIPTEEEIYEFAHQLFKTVQLSSECSIVCLIYIERLMEASKVPLLADTWRPIFMCGLLLASKVWQDLSSWNIEFASVYPQFSLDAINRLELQFLRMVKWDLYISSSLYAKYYFALRSLVEKQGFRQRYNRMVGGVDSVAASEALKVQKRTEQVKEEALMQLSRSM